MVFTERDRELLGLVYRLGFCLGRHIKELVNFSSYRVCDRRLAVLITAGYLTRKKYLYGVPYLYTVTHKGRILIGANKRENKIRLEQINHDIYVIDVLIYFRDKYALHLNDFVTERELHIEDGFGGRKHHPDFVFVSGGKAVAVEVELTAKSKVRLEKNIRDNYLKYDYQIWLTDNKKVHTLINKIAEQYNNIEVMHLEGVLEKCRATKPQG